MSPELEAPNWNRCPGAAVCFALCHAEESSKDALIVAQAQQLDRVMGGYEAPDPDDWFDDDDEPEPATPPVDVMAAVTAAMNHDDIFRKPGRVAAPNLIERLALAGIYLTTEEPE